MISDAQSFGNIGLLFCFCFFISNTNAMRKSNNQLLELYYRSISNFFELYQLKLYQLEIGHKISYFYWANSDFKFFALFTFAQS
jgi:hypothetical protein